MEHTSDITKGQIAKCAIHNEDDKLLKRPEKTLMFQGPCYINMDFLRKYFMLCSWITIAAIPMF